MSSRSPEPWRVLWLLLAASFGAGCSASHECAKPEVCNGRDDDCDGRNDEDFLDARGRYVQDEHCGGCGVSCAEVFPTAVGTRCDPAPEQPVCRLLTCPAGSHPVGDGACASDVTVQCLPCEDDADCDLHHEGARCLTVGNEQRCAEPCVASTCAEPFACDPDFGLCTPELGLCACSGVSDTFEVACIAEGPAEGSACAGVQVCTPQGLGQCEIASEETCNGEDDDCDGDVDEDFVDLDGRYIGRLHCGSCGSPCVPPGANYEANCLPDGASASCDIACVAGFVDVDGVQGNGCECQIFDGTTAPVIVGTDSDCDGEVDDNDVFVHVTNGGSDSAPGTLLRPMRSISAAVERASAEDKTVLVAQGRYAPFRVISGVNVFGGYRSDFRDRNTELYPVFVEQTGAANGAPVLTCENVTGATQIDGLTLVGTDAASAGQGSTTVHLQGCSSAVRLADLTLLAGRGRDGTPGADASERLPDGVPSLADLNGRDGRNGRDGGNSSESCSTLSGGAGGARACGGASVSGGSGGAAECANIGCANGFPCANAGCTDFTSGGVCDYDTVLDLAVANPAGEDGRGPRPGDGGESTYNAPTNRGLCSFCDDNPTLPRLGDDGEDGSLGSDGAGGDGCNADTLVIDTSGRASARGGSAGTTGSDGSGGGGGSAGNGYSVIGGTQGGCGDVPGGSGGGGGAM